MDAKVLVLLTLLLASLHSEVGGQTSTIILNSSASASLTTTPSPTITPTLTTTTSLLNTPSLPNTTSMVASGSGSTVIEPFSEVSVTPTPSPNVPPTTAPPTTTPPTTAPPTAPPTNGSETSSTTDSTSPPTTTSASSETTTASPAPTESVVGPVVGGVAGAIALILIVLIAILIFIICRPRWRKMAYINERSHTLVGSTDPLLVNTIALEDTLNGKVGSPMFQKPVPIEQFPQHVKQLHANVDQGMEDEFQSMGTRPMSSYNASKLPHNIPKNRFENIFPYDSSRVKLFEIAGVPGSDYINASFMNGYNKLNGYIAAQGPLEDTIKDFWRMVWEYKLPTIVMLTETVEAGRDKCARYWPEKDKEPWAVGYNLTVTLTEHRQFAEYKVKNFTVKDTKTETGTPLKVTHFHFSAWPDHGVPADKTCLIQFIQRVRKSHKYDGPPLLVHCSAGVGRTGTFMTLDSMLQRMKAKEDTLDVYEFICHLRVKRPLMVQTEIQYAFIHDALEEFITCGDTAIAVTNLWITINKLKSVSEGKSGFLKQFELLGEVSHVPTAVNCNEALEEFNIKKNRYPPVDHLPYNLTRVRLRPTGVKGADYINASFVDGYKHRRAYIVTQGPLESTVNDFWRMISEHKSRTIVMLCNLEEEEKECCFPYWPKEKDTTMTYGRLKVQLLSEQDCGDFVIRKLEIGEADSHYQVPGVPDGIVITQFHHTKWSEKGEPPVTSSILRLIDALVKTQISTGNQAITVMCNDGIGRSGTFTCIYSQLERIKAEGVADVFQYIKASRLQRPGLVSEVEQFTFCHYVLADYIDSFDTYANFKDWA